MDWPLKNPAFFDEDLDNLYRYEPRRSKGVYRFEGDKDITECWLDIDQDVSRWLEKVTQQRSRGKPGIAVILAARTEQPGIPHNPAILEYLPFSRESFEKIVTTLPLHGDTARVVNRYNMAFFTSIDLLDSPANAICLCLLFSHTHALTLSMSHSHSTYPTYYVFPTHLSDTANTPPTTQSTSSARQPPTQATSPSPPSPTQQPPTPTPKPLITPKHPSSQPPSS
ncbi:hypothetical protein B0I37DRAFT_68382 [Chaetomium sp. MPI-CAGE-AT-0009]|nr:hypothetical protein B0I37DRAFT_68382 [Chaetomium sp. MPI-CAGE-AT-0009]